MLLLLLLLPGCAARDCQLETVFATRIVMAGTLPLMVVGINEKPAVLVFDTGADLSVLTRVAAARLGISGSTRQISGQAAGGPTRFELGRIDRLTIGPARRTNVPVVLADGLPPPIDGLLGINVLQDFEVELDAPRGSITFYRARSCSDARPPWAGPYEQLVVQQQPGTGFMLTPVELNGSRVSGLLDTGSSISSVSIQAAGEAGFSGARLAALPAGRALSMNAGGAETRLAEFGIYKVGQTTFDKPLLPIMALPASAGDMLIGGEYLSTRRVWFSLRLGKVFVAESR